MGSWLGHSTRSRPGALPQRGLSTSGRATPDLHANPGGGAVLQRSRRLDGAIAGGAIGNAVGDGSGRALATMIGILGGAMVGERVEGPGQTAIQHQTTCSTQTVYENRLVGYNVVYEYAGKQYTVQLPQDPGPTIPLNISPAVQGLQGTAPPPVSQATVITTLPQVVYSPAPVYRVQPPIYSYIDLNWSNQRPVVRLPGHRHPAQGMYGPHATVRENRHHWR